MGLMDGAGSAALGAGLGLITAKWQDDRQLEQQGKLTAQQIEAQKKMADYNQRLAMDMWEKTNYEAQREQMEKAGLNVGLMYKGAGQGGVTQQASGNATGGNAAAGNGEIGMGIQMGMQKAMQEAQIENIKANTEKTKVDTTKTAGIDTTEGQTRVAEAGARMEAIRQGITNAQTQNAIQQFEKQIKEIELKYADQNQQTAIEQLKASTGKLIEDTIQQAQQNKISAETMESVVKEAKLTMIGTSLMNELTREKVINTTANTEETWSKINKISAEIERMTAQTEQGARGLSQEDQKILIQQIATEFNYGEHAQIIRWIGAIGGAVSDVASIVSRGKGLKLQERKLNEQADQFNRKNP